MLNHEHICLNYCVTVLGFGSMLPVTYMILQFELCTLSSMYAPHASYLYIQTNMAKSTLDMGQSDLEDFTDAQDTQDWLSTLTKSRNKVRELQSLLIA